MHTVIFLLFLGNALAVVGIVVSLQSTWHKIRARKILVQQLVDDDAYRSELEQVRYTHQCGNQQELEITRQFVAKHLVLFDRKKKTAVEEALYQPSQAGRARYLKWLLNAVELRVQKVGWPVA